MSEKEKIRFPQSAPAANVDESVSPAKPVAPPKLQKAPPPPPGGPRVKQR